MLVTGFETYCKNRFLELESEGINPNFEQLITKFLSREERNQGEDVAIKKDATQEGISPTKKLINQRRIDFQNYDRCKKAYNKGYGIKFGEIGIPNTQLEDIQQMIRFRHRIVHISPRLSMLNSDRVPPEDPIFSKREYIENKMKVLNEFIKQLHTATLQLRTE